jgi:hypothetical protein
MVPQATCGINPLNSKAFRIPCGSIHYKSAAHASEFGWQFPAITMMANFKTQNGVSREARRPMIEIFASIFALSVSSCSSRAVSRLPFPNNGASNDAR